MSNNSNIIKAYKGFNKDMTSLYGNFQYEEDKEYEIEGKLELCSNGFHACTNPLDVFKYYYDIRNSVYHEVELYGDIISDYKDSKLCASKIKIGRRLDIIKDILEPNLDTDTEVVKYEENIIRYCSRSIIAYKSGDIITSNYLAGGVTGSYLVLYDIYTYKIIALKVDGNRIKENCCYRYCNGKIEEYNNLQVI